MSGDVVAPAEFGLPHDEWRPGQYETVVSLLGRPPASVSVLEAPTGSGKTAIARALGANNSVTALSRTKVLQQENYEDAYGFPALFGRANYPCALEPLLTGNECEYAEVGMHKCPEVLNCEYLIRRKEVQDSRLKALNYAYWFTAPWPRSAHTDWLVCDEAHLISSLVLDFVGTTVTAKQRSDWRLPMFPLINSHSGSVLPGPSPVDSAIAWLVEARKQLRIAYSALERQSRNRRNIKTMRQCENLGRKLRATLDALRRNPADWYIVSGSRARYVAGRRVPGFICKPLTARHHAPIFFQGNWRLLLMSATIGDEETFASELGLTAWSGTRVPGAWAPEQRPVWAPAKAPRLGYATSKHPQLYDEQAKMIAKMINSVPRDWSGVIHHTSKDGAKNLAARLSRFGLEDRLWMPSMAAGTDSQMEAWQRYRAQVPNALAVAYSWHTGIDLLDEKICVVAKTPFPYLGSGYEQARQKYDGKLYLQRTAWTLEQACGRTRRGRPEDYDEPGGEMRGLVAIMDGNWRRCQKYLSPAFRAAIQEV